MFHAYRQTFLNRLFNSSFSKIFRFSRSWSYEKAIFDKFQRNIEGNFLLDFLQLTGNVHWIDKKIEISRAWWQIRSTSAANVLIPDTNGPPDSVFASTWTSALEVNTAARRRTEKRASTYPAVTSAFASSATFTIQIRESVFSAPISNKSC